MPAKATLVDAIRKSVAEPAFKEYMRKNYQPDGFLGPEDFKLMGRLLQKLGEKT